MSDHFYAGGGIGLGPRPEPALTEPYPEPELASHSLDGSCCPSKSAVLDLVAYAGKFGWSTWVTHARGHLPHATTGRPGGVKDSLAVRLSRGDERAVAVYFQRTKSDWGWQAMHRWSPAQVPARFPAITLFRVLLPYRLVAGWPQPLA